jgi:hypothetical protein
MDSTKKPLTGMCESCMMPFTKDPQGENRGHEKYCSYCFADGKLCYKGTDVREFKRAMVDTIVAHGEPRWKARIFAFMAGFAPRWKGQRSIFGKLFGSYGQKCEDAKK